MAHRTSPARRARPGLQYADLRGARVSPKDAAAELMRLLNTPLGQQPTLSELLPALKKRAEGQELQDTKLKDLIGTAKLKAVEPGVDSRQVLSHPQPRLGKCCGHRGKVCCGLDWTGRILHQLCWQRVGKLLAAGYRSYALYCLALPTLTPQYIATYLGVA